MMQLFHWAAAALLLLCGWLTGSAFQVRTEQHILQLQRTVELLQRIRQEIAYRRLDLEQLQKRFSYVIPMTAKDGDGLEALRQAVEQLFYTEQVTPELGIVSNARQKQCLEQAKEQIQLALDALAQGELLDAVTVLLEEAADSLLSLTGERVSEAVVDDVFSRFCVGK